MPLTTANDNSTLKADGVYFLMRDGNDEVICRIDLETLRRVGEPIGLQDAVRVFEVERDKIERAASDKYDRTSRGAYEVVSVTAADLGLGAN